MKIDLLIKKEITNSNTSLVEFKIIKIKSYEIEVNSIQPVKLKKKTNKNKPS